MENEVRLIDANALIQDAEDVLTFPMLDRINRAETIDPESLRPKGRWIIKKSHYVSQNPYVDDNYHASATCSECNFCIHADCGRFGYPELNTTNYCPNCGAKMMED